MGSVVTKKAPGGEDGITPTPSVTPTETNGEEAAKVRFLLIGAGGVGKSTIFKQMKLLYVNKGKGFTEEYKAAARTQIRENLLESLCDLARFCCEHSEKDASVSLVGEDEEEEDDDLLDSVDAIAGVVGDLKGSDEGDDAESSDAHFTDAVCADAVKIVKTPGFQKALVLLKRGGKVVEALSILESARYFLETEHVVRILKPDYVPNESDVLHLRRTTEDVNELEYSIEVETEFMNGPQTLKVVVTDVGGQAQERSNWVPRARNASAVLYLCAISDFDRVNNEGENQLLSQLSLFQQVVQTEALASPGFVILLNKSDIFKEKIKHNSIKSVPCFSDYSGKENDFQDGVDYFVQKFKEKLSAKKTKFYCHYAANATDSKMMKTVLMNAQTANIEANMKNSGFG